MEAENAERTTIEELEQLLAEVKGAAGLANEWETLKSKVNTIISLQKV